MTSTNVYYDITLKTPCRMIVFGPSGSGKSSLIERMLIYSQEVFGCNFDTIKYISGQSFPDIDHVNGIKVEKYNELEPDLLKNLNHDKKNIIIFDDNIYVTNDRLLSDIFTKISHHMNLTVILLLQNLFPKTKYGRDISINSTYIILMANPRESTQIKRLSQQIDGTNFIYKAFLDNTKDKPFSYLVLDFHQNTPDILRVRSSLFDSEMYIYVKKETK